MKRIVAILMLCIGVSVVLFMIPGWLERIHLEPKTHSRPAKSFRRELAEGVRIGRHGAYGGDFVRCGKCFLEKMRKGDKLVTGNSKLNKIIDWFYEGAPVYFIFLEDRILNQDFKLLMDHLKDEREHAAADKWKQKDYIHKLNCSK